MEVSDVNVRKPSFELHPFVCRKRGREGRRRNGTSVDTGGASEALDIVGMLQDEIDGVDRWPSQGGVRETQESYIGAA